MRYRTKLTAGVLAAFLSLAAVACEGGTAGEGDPGAGDPMLDDGMDEPGADPGADLPADSGEGDL